MTPKNYIFIDEDVCIFVANHVLDYILSEVYLRMCVCVCARVCVCVCACVCARAD